MPDKHVKVSDAGKGKDKKTPKPKYTGKTASAGDIARAKRMEGVPIKK